MRWTRLVATLMVGVGLVAIGAGIYFTLTEPKLSILGVGAGYVDSGRLSVPILIENDGRVHAFARVVCEMRYPGVGDTYTGELSVELDTGELGIFVVNIEVPSSLLYERGYLYCDLVEVRR